MESTVRHVHTYHDPETGHWWAESDDLPGLVSEAATLDALCDRVVAVVPDLLRASGYTGPGITLAFVAERQVEMA